jgi:hypothetical protein
MGLRGEVFSHNGYAILVSDFAGELQENMGAPLRKSVEISGPWEAPIQFDAEEFSQMVGDVHNCARKVGAWEPKR